MVNFTINLHHDGCFVTNPLHYLEGDHRVVEDIDFEGVIYSEFCHIIRKLVIIAPVSYFYVKTGVQLNIGLKQLKTDEDLKEFVKAGSENDFKMDIYTEHNGYNVMEMIRNDNLIDEVDDPPFSDTESQDSLGDVKEVADFQTEDDSNVEIPKISSDDPWLNKLVGKGKFIGHMDDPIPNLNGRFMIEIDDPEQEVIDSQYKAKKEVQYPAFDPETPWDQCKPFLGMRFETPAQLPVYTIDPVLPKQKAPPSGGSTSQSGTKRGASGSEHAFMMDQEALAETLRAEEAEHAAIREIWRQNEEIDKTWEAYANEFSEADFNQDFEDQIGIALTAEDSLVPAAIPTQHSQVKSKGKEHFTPANVEASTTAAANKIKGKERDVQPSTPVDAKKKRGRPKKATTEPSLKPSTKADAKKSKGKKPADVEASTTVAAKKSKGKEPAYVEASTKADAKKTRGRQKNLPQNLHMEEFITRIEVDLRELQTRTSHLSLTSMALVLHQTKHSLLISAF
ncbi:hypothetical protein Tco_1271197 [Tanacetum coccineum]